MKLIQTDEEITVNWVKRFAEYEVSERPGGLSLRRSDTNGGWVDIIDIPQGLIVCGDWDPVVFQYNSGSFASKVAWMGNRPRGAFDGYFCEKARMGTGYNASLHEFDLEQAKVDLKEMQQDHLESYDGENQIHRNLFICLY